MARFYVCGLRLSTFFNSFQNRGACSPTVAFGTRSYIRAAFSHLLYYKSPIQVDNLALLDPFDPLVRCFGPRKESFPSVLTRTMTLITADGCRAAMLSESVGHLIAGTRCRTRIKWRGDDAPSVRNFLGHDLPLSHLTSL